jgi:hypothetical protein
MKPAAGVFLGGAGSRLLPASIPFRFFGAAVTYHLLAWIALLAGAPHLPRFAGGLSWPLAGLHLVTLGVLVMTAIGASLQLLPVATRQPVHSTRWAIAIWWLYAPGVGAVAAAMGIGLPWLLALGAAAVGSALLVYGALLAINLSRARGMPAVVAHGWGALLSLLAVLASAGSLTFAYLGMPMLDRGTALALHVVFAAYGFMGLLALGLSYILVPMFALAAAPDERQALGSAALAAAALLLASAAALGALPQTMRMPADATAVALGAAAVLLHLKLMRQALRGGMRRELGRSFTLVRIAWVCLLGSLVAAAAMAIDLPYAATPTLLGLMLIGGWLMSFLFGILQRILPFLAAMHAGRGRKRPPTPSSLSAERPLAVHFWCHLAALAGLALACIFDSSLLAALAAGSGAVGAAAFGVFYLTLLRRMRARAAPPDGGPTPMA